MIKDIIQAAFIITARKLAAFVGQIISTGSIIGNGLQNYEQALQHVGRYLRRNITSV